MHDLAVTDMRRDSCLETLVNSAIVLKQFYGDDFAKDFLVRIAAPNRVIDRVITGRNLRPLPKAQISRVECDWLSIYRALSETPSGQ